MKKLLIGLSLLGSVASFGADTMCEKSINTLIDISIETGNNTKFASLQTDILNAPDGKLTEAGLAYKNRVKAVINQKEVTIRSCDLSVDDINNLVVSAISTGYFGKHDVLDLAILEAPDTDLSRAGIVYKYAVKNTLALKEAILR